MSWSEVVTTILSTRISSFKAAAVEEIAKRRGTTVSKLLNKWITEAIEREMGLKTETELLMWARDFELKKV
jgi:transposase-like protein